MLIAGNVYLNFYRTPGRTTTLRYRRTQNFLIHLEAQGQALLIDLQSGDYSPTDAAIRADRWSLLLLATLRQTFGEHDLVTRLANSARHDEHPERAVLLELLRAQLEVLTQALAHLPSLDVLPGGSTSL